MLENYQNMSAMKPSKKNVYLFEINDVLTNQIKLPYSTGVIWSYCITDDTVNQNYELADWFYYRQDPEKILSSIDNPSVVAFNCFVWNAKFNDKLAKQIKEKWPDCLIVYGGWYPPTADRSHDYFKTHQYVDIVVHGEGEITFHEILLENLKTTPVWESVAGCSIPVRLINDPGGLETHVIKDGLKTIEKKSVHNLGQLDTYVTPPRARIKDINCMPSPYLNGLFDELVKDCPYELETTIETTRGCPYQCTFCEIGTRYYQKIKTNKLDKVFKEIDWISDNKVLFVYNADSNFGMLPEHLEVTKYFVEKKKTTGYPDKHRCDWAKNKADKVIELAKIFYDADMDKGITIAVQSMSPKVLDAVKRKNVDDGKLGEFLKMYNDLDLPSYMELILGLPEETLDSFIDGICQIIELEQHNYIGIYPLTALPNTPFGEPSYIEEYGLELLETYTAFHHYFVDELSETEREMMIVGSRTMSHDEYKECHIYRWVFMFGHYLAYTQYISRYLREAHDVSYRDFYVTLLEYMRNNPDTFMGSELLQTIDAVNGVMEVRLPWGRIVDDVMPKFAWDFEEATALLIAKNGDTFYDELRDFVDEHFDISNDILDDLMMYQKLATVNPTTKYPFDVSLNNNVHNVIYDKVSPAIKPCTLTFEAKNYDGDYFKWGKETLWWGRRVAANKVKVVEVK